MNWSLIVQKFTSTFEAFGSVMAFEKSTDNLFSVLTYLVFLQYLAKRKIQKLSTFTALQCNPKDTEAHLSVDCFL